jgi:hypothetical protein
MISANRGLFAAAVVLSATLVAALVAPIVVGVRLQHLGYDPMWMFGQPHYAYLIARGRHDVAWQNLRIQVSDKYVIEEDGDRVFVRPLEPGPILLGLIMSFRPANDSTTQAFDRVQQRCTAGIGNCEVHEVVASGTPVVCLERRGTRKPLEFEMWQCRIPNGIEVRFLGTPAQCAEQEKIALAAFASAITTPSAFGATLPTSRDSTSR